MRRNVEAVQTVDRAHGKIDTLCSTIVRRWKAAGFDQPDRYNVNSTRAECPVLQSQLNAEDIISLDSECYGVDVPNDSNYDDNKMEVLEVYGGAGCFETASRGNNGQTTIASLLGDIDSIKKSVLNREVAARPSSSKMSVSSGLSGSVEVLSVNNNDEETQNEDCDMEEESTLPTERARSIDEVTSQIPAGDDVDAADVVCEAEVCPQLSMHGTPQSEGSPVPALSRHSSSSSLSSDALISNTASFRPVPIEVISVDETDVRILNTGEIVFCGEILSDKGAPIKRGKKEQKKSKMAVSEKKTAKKDVDKSDIEVIDVVSDEDLEMQELIKEEKRRRSGKPPKKDKQKRSSKKSRTKHESEDSDEDPDRLLRMADTALNGEVPDEVDEEDEVESEDSDAEPNMNGHAAKKTRSQTKSLASSKPNGSAFLKRLRGKEVTNANGASKESSKSKAKPSKVESDVSSDEGVSVSKKKLSKKEKELANLVSSAQKLLDSSSDEEDKSSTSSEVPVKKAKPAQRKRRRVVASDSDASVEENSESDSEDGEEKSEVDDGEEEIIIAKPKSKKKREAECESDDSTGGKKGKSGKGSRAPKNIMGKDKLQQETIDAEKAERERRKRLEQKQKEFNGIELMEGVDIASVLVGGTNTVQKLKSVVVDPDKNGDPPHPVSVHPSLVRVLKPHQAQGIQFMYDSAFESVDRLDEDGGGGILAHCMGLGKTLQVITFLHTVMLHPKIKDYVKRVLIVVPKNVVLNWFKEFQKWLDDNDPELASIEVMELDSFKTYNDRRAALDNWYNCEVPSVMIIGYDMFRILTHDDEENKKKRGVQKKPPTKRNKRLLKLQQDFRQFLQDPGPDLVVCDEAHKLKNDESALSKTMVKIRTRRRICLTGTPLQNNLMEYHCMVNFVKPGLLGTKTEFANRFANIIMRGRVKDATPLEVKFMKRRCHVLFEHLKKCVDRKDYRVLMEAIPPKQEYVINVRLTPRQCELYRAFLDGVASDGARLSKRLLPDYHVLARVWTHPYMLVLHEQKQEKERMLRDEGMEDEQFIDDGSGSTSDSDDYDDDVVVKPSKKNKKDKAAGDDSDSDVILLDDEEDGPQGANEANHRKSRRLGGEDPEMEGRDVETPPEYSGWFSQLGLVSPSDRDDYTLSNKLVLLVQILKKCEEIGDKLLVFSQSLESLNLIKRTLEFLDQTGQWFSDNHEAIKAAGEKWGWKEGKDYMVIDGSVQSGKRDAVQTKFNNPLNLRARLMLISTRAGSLGTNMVAANRVIIFDACWNPSHDTQSLFRVYRFGQTKPVYIYRFIAQGTMEERIYKRQVTKESTSMRVVDEAQIQRHYDGHDLEELYLFDPKELDTENANERPNFAPPKDRLLADILLTKRDAVVDYFQHDTLFAHVEEEKLSEEELKEAWNDYERDKTMNTFGRGSVSLLGMGVGGMAQNQIGLVQQAQNLLLRNQALQQLNRDVVYVNCFNIPLMDNDTAMKVTYLKKCLEDLLPNIPHDMRGGISEFNSYFINFITQAVENRHNPAWMLNRAVSTFRTVVKLVQDQPSCRPALRQMYSTTSQFFDPMEPPP